MADLDKLDAKECEICYQTQLLHYNKITLPCKHELCNNCLKNLRNETCPFCRTPFRKLEYIKTENVPNIIQNISINITIDYFIQTEELVSQREHIEINYEQRIKNYEKKYKYFLSKDEKNKRRKIRKNYFRNNSCILLY